MDLSFTVDMYLSNYRNMTDISYYCGIFFSDLFFPVTESDKMTDSSHILSSYPLSKYAAYYSHKFFVFKIKICKYFFKHFFSKCLHTPQLLPDNLLQK